MKEAGREETSTEERGGKAEMMVSSNEQERKSRKARRETPDKLGTRDGNHAAPEMQDDKKQGAQRRSKVYFGEEREKGMNVD